MTTKLTPFQARLIGFLISGHRLWYNTAKQRYQVDKKTIRESTVERLLRDGYLLTGHTLPDGSFRLNPTHKAKQEIRK